MDLINQKQQLGPNTNGKEVKNGKTTNGTNTNGITNGSTNGSGESAVLYSNLNTPPSKAISSKGCWITTEDGLDIIDASSGAAVACLGHNDSRVNAAIQRQLEKVAYCYAPFLTSEPVEKLALELSKSTGHRLPKAFIVSSGNFTAL
jgi:4-aminobutyrate aminotransferase-like enzyme